MSRQLATIRRIATLTPIEGADRIELATMENLSWQAVVRKGEFTVGQTIIYVECDSILPFAPWSEFLRSKDNPDKVIRIRTVKLKKQISQGVIFPLSILPTDHPIGIEEGSDMTEILNISKYEVQIPACLSGTVRGNYPQFLIKSDENRLQSLRSSIYDEFHGKECYVTLKMDGTSSGYYKNGEDVGVCSRNMLLKEPEADCETLPIYWKMERKYDILNKLKNLPQNIQLVGESVGPSIQGNRLGLKDHDLAIFTGFDIDKQEYLGFRQLQKVCEELAIPMVPVLDVFVFDKNIHTLAYWLEYAKGKYEGTQHDREGIVIRPTGEMYSETLHGRLSVKVINNDFLLKEE